MSENRGGGACSHPATAEGEPTEAKEGLPVTRFWYLVHNLIAHPLLVTGWAWAERFHDWTAERM